MSFSDLLLTKSRRVIKPLQIG